MAEEIDLKKVRFSELQKPCDFVDLDLGSGHTAYRSASVVGLFLHTKISLKSENFFVDGLTAGTPASSRSRNTQTRTNIKNPARQI